MSSNNKWLIRYFLPIYVGINGFTIMSAEMAASRFLAPYFGSSVIVWTNVIGIIMLALSAGYYVGGLLSKKSPTIQKFFILGASGGVILLLIPILLASFLQSLIITTNSSTLILPFLISVCVFGVPIFVLGTLSPYAVRIASKELNTVGSEAGVLYSVSTFGSILGVYLTTFVLVPFLGTSQTIVVTGLSMVLMSLGGILYFTRSNKPKTIFILIGCLFISCLPTILPIYKRNNVLAEVDTVYQKVRIFKENGRINMQFNNTSNIQSIYNPDGLWTGYYADYYPVLFSATNFDQKKDFNILVAGYAGGTVGKILHAFKPDNVQISIDGVEIDQDVSKLGKEYMDVKDTERNLYTADARTFIASSPKKYDIIILDCYNNELEIPPHLITQEFFRSVKDKLASEGTMVLNLNSIDPKKPFMQTSLNTINSVFESVQYAYTNVTNYMVIAQNRPIEFESSKMNYNTILSQNASHIQSNIILHSYNPRQPIFTDDKNNSDILSIIELSHLTNLY